MIKITIGNTDILCKQNFTIKEEILNTSSTILNNCYPSSWEATKDYSSNFYYPENYSQCKIEQIINNTTTLIFSGIVKNTSNISLNPREPKYCSLQILDNKTLLSEGKTLDFVISEKTIIEAIQMVTNAISDYGFVLGTVNILNENDIIGAYSTFNKTAYDVYQYLADISGAKWTVTTIDETTRQVNFYDPTLMPQGKQIEYTTEWACENNLINMYFKYGTQDYRNNQVILSNEVNADITYTETFIGDSYNRQFTLSTPVGSVSSITVNGNNVSFASEQEKELGVFADFYYSYNSNIISSNDTQLPYANGTKIIITFTPLIKGRQSVSNENEITRISNNLNVNGLISRYETRNDINNSDKLLAIAETYLKYKGEAEITLTLETLNNNLYEIGQTVYFNAPINQIAKNYMVKSKEINIYATDTDSYNVFYKFELSSSFNSERAINWFDNQRNKYLGNIEKGQFISRNIDINNNANVIWNNLVIEEL